MKISEAIERHDISADTLCYYQRVGLIPPINRTEGGIREFIDEDSKWVSFIKCMRSVGLSIEALTEYAKLVQQGDQTIMARKEIMLGQREELLEKMEEMQVTLHLLNYNIEVYENAVLNKEKDLREG